MSTPNYVKDLEERVSLLEQQRSPSFPTPETLFDIFDGIRVRRPFLGLTRDSVRDICRKTAADLGIEVSDDYPGYLWGDGTDPHEDVTEVLKSE